MQLRPFGAADGAAEELRFRITMDVGALSAGPGGAHFALRRLALLHRRVLSQYLLCGTQRSGNSLVRSQFETAASWSIDATLEGPRGAVTSVLRQ